MKTFLLFLLKLALAAIFALALNIIIPFNTASGLGFVKMHGKWLLFAIGFVNVYVGGALSGSFLSKSIRTGFKNWAQPTVIRGQLNPTRLFAAIILIWNLIVIIWGIQP
jgi:hypothetical protein